MRTWKISLGLSLPEEEGCQYEHIIACVEVIDNTLKRKKKKLTKLGIFDDYSDEEDVMEYLYNARDLAIERDEDAICEMEFGMCQFYDWADMYSVWVK